MSKTPEQVTEALLRSFPHELLEDKNGMRYIAHDHVRLRLIEATDNQFTWRVLSTEYRNDGALKVRTDRNTGEPLPVPPVCVVHGELEIPALNSVRAGVGVQEMEAGSGADSAYKGAESDAFKRAAMAYGVGLRQLYIGEDLPERLKTGKEKAAARAQSTASPRPENGQSANNTGHGANGAHRPPQDGPTPKQLEALEHMAKVRNIPMDEIEAEAVRRYKVARISGMSMGDASKLIDWLKAEPKRDLNGIEPGVHDAPPPSTDAKREAFKAKIIAAAQDSIEAIEALCDEADTPGKWVMLARMMPDTEALDVVGMAAVDRSAFGPHLEKAIAARKAELAGK